MKKVVLFILFGTQLWSTISLSQSLPVTTDTAIHVNVLMNARRNAIRIAKNPIDNLLYYITGEGSVYKILNNGSNYTDTLIANATQHAINSLQGFLFKDSAMYLVGNHKVAGTAGYALVVRGKFQSSGQLVWDTLLHTSTYQSSATLYDHQFNGICLSVNGDSLYIASGARTDHGEIETTNGLYPNTREVALTSHIYKIPVNPPATIFLNNDSATIAGSPYLFCSGVRNSFDIALTPNGDILATENSGDRDDPEELNWFRQGSHYGFPWRMGGNNTPMQYPGYVAANDKMINHKSLGWGNGTTTNRFYNDSTYPQAPAGVTFMEPIKNYGPDADKYRDPADGSVHDASNTGVFITSFTPHRSPLGLLFDNAGKLAAPYNYGGFVLCYTAGSIDTTGVVGNSTGPFSDTGQDMLQLALYKDTATQEYSMNCYRIAYNFNKPVDAFLDNNVIYIIESHTQNDTVVPRIYSLSFPSNAQGGMAPFLKSDTTVCSGTTLSLIPNLKGQFQYLWSTGATTSQITVAPTLKTTYWLKINNGMITLTDSITIQVSAPPAIPGSITTTGGNTRVCPGDSRTYTVALVTGITYNWTVPTGAVINSGQGTRIINVTYNNNFIANGTLSVSATNGCATSALRSIAISRNVASTPGTISGQNFGLCGAMNINYVVTNVTGVTYAWTAPVSAVIISGQGSNSILVNFPSTNFSGTISVTATNACGSSAIRSRAVKAVPNVATTINGNAIVCSNSNGNAYNIMSILSATNYTWTGPTGSHITASNGTSPANVLTTNDTAVTMNFGVVTATSKLYVRANNLCGNGSLKSLSLSLCSPVTTLNNISSLNSLEVSPNPSAGSFTFTLNEPVNGNYSFTLYDMIGKRLFSEVLKVNEKSFYHLLDLSKMEAGIYLLTISSPLENKTIKLIKK